jgi:sulfoxide reductase catalytic subunit YedY
MLIRKPNSLTGSNIPSSEITPKEKWLNRRSFIAAAAHRRIALGTGAQRHSLAFAPSHAAGKARDRQEPALHHRRRAHQPQGHHHYNNFYEFGVEKAPSQNAGGLPTRPWSDQSLRPRQDPKNLRHRRPAQTPPPRRPHYRHRCVEGWSMVIPGSATRSPNSSRSASRFPAPNTFSSSAISTAKSKNGPPSATTGPIPKACAWTKP